MIRWWRHVALAGATGGLLLCRGLDAPPGTVPLAAAGALALALVGLRGSGTELSPVAHSCALALAATLGLVAGLAAGDARLRAIDSGALRPPAGVEGARARVVGFVAGLPRSSQGKLRFPLESEAGRVLVVANLPGSGAEIAAGSRLAVRGALREPEGWRSDEAARLGVALEFHAESLRIVPGTRGGVDGMLDRARARAERAVAAGLDPEQEALARGFVLGQDDRIDEATREEFRRSGLAHLLAVSGQNVMLLAILGGVLLALLRVEPRARLVAIIVLIAVYVPLAGSGPSIQRAGVMGAAGILAGLAGRGSDRIYLPLLAAVVTLLLNPHSAADVGWQLSFAAIIGIALWAAPMRELLSPWLSRRTPLPDRLATPLAEGAALTVAAVVATAPLMALQFEAVSLAALPANLLVLPAVAPVMWLGMLAALLGQLPLVPTAPLGAVEGPLLDYIAAVAGVLARPDWAQIDPPAPGVFNVALLYGLLLLGVGATLRALGRRRGHRAAPLLRALVASGAAVAIALAVLPDGPGVSAVPAGTLRVTALDVGQGDAILLQPSGGPAALIDTGPPGAGIGAALRRHGVSRLGALLITHDQLDHSGALGEVFAAVPVEHLIVAREAPGIIASSEEAGVEVQSLAGGASLRLGRLVLEVLSPAAGSTPAADPNEDSLVLLARYARRRVLLSGDAEAEAVPLDPGPLDVLKVAHHGSADAGLPAMLARSAPEVALLSVGAGNPHGHPTPETLEQLAAAGACTLRTDERGDAWVELSKHAIEAGGTSGGNAPACTG